VKFIGYCPVIPFKRGDKVRIPKGTLVKTCTKGVRITGRTYTITVDHVLHGAEYDDTVHNPVVVWPGTGGYWSEADINDVEKVQ
jgi:hypothetical protein